MKPSGYGEGPLPENKGAGGSERRPGPEEQPYRQTGAGGEAAQPAARGSVAAWLPIPLLLGVMAVLWIDEGRTSSYGTPYLLMTLNFVFTTLVSLFIAFLVGRSFLVRGTPALLLLGCGVLIWGAVGFVSVAVGKTDINSNVSIFNIGAWLSAFCHLAGAVLSLRPGLRMRASGMDLGFAYAAALALLALVAHATASGWVPVFFVQGWGGTPLRQAVVGSATGMFALSAVVLRVAHRKSLSPFLHWYTLALLLIATGSLGVLVQSSFGDPLNWTARGTQYLGGIYMLAAAVVSVRDSREWEVSLEASLAEARQRYEDLLELAADGIVTYELAGEPGRGLFVQSNEAIRKLLGYTAQDMRGLTPADLTPEEERPSLVPAREELLREGVLRHEQTLMARDGRRIAVEINARVFHGQGRTMVMAVIRDMTERKRAEEQVRELSQRLTYHVENSPLAVIEWGPDMRLARWSAAAERIFGWKAEEVLGKRMEDFRWIYEEDTPRVAEVSMALNGGTSRQSFSANRNYRKDGTVVECEWYNSSLVDEAGRLRSILSLILDVTARNEAEARLEEAKRLLDALMENVPEGIAIADASDMRIRAVSRYAERVLGGRHSEMRVAEVAARWRVYQADGVTPLKDEDLPLMRAMRNGEMVHDLEVVQTDEAGGRVPILCNAAPIRDAGGNIVGGVVAWRDLTERKRAEERLRQAQKLESIGLLAGGIAHDFNNILVGVIGNASMAADTLPPGHPAGEMLERIVQSGEHAAHLTRQMLAYSGKGRFVVEPLDLSAQVMEIAGLVRPSIPGKVTLNLDLGRDLPPVEADRGQIQQVVMNLLLNAGEAIGGETGLISVRTGVRGFGAHEVPRELEGAELRPGRYVFLEVRDTGCGMDGATRARIFDPFFTTKFTGRGLGLAAVAGILRGHQGAIRVTSEPGNGSCFAVFFPAAEAGARAAAPALRPREDLRGSGTVLLVDDEEVVRLMARRALEGYGFTVLTADSGTSAIDVFRREASRIALVILDLSMPGMSGAETLEELRKIRPAVKVVASSGYSRDETMRLFQGQPVFGFIQKPYTAGRLAETVKSAIG